MPVGDLGDYDVQPVEGNPFGSMASSPNDYDVAPVDHDPFAPDQFELASRQPEATPSSAGGPPLDPRDREDLIRTVYGEAGDQPALGQAGVAHAILNRVHAGGYGDGISGVVHAPAAGVNPKFGYHEFSPWNTGRAKEGNPTAQNLSPDSRDPRLAKSYRDIGDVVDKAYSGLIPDPTHGATHYYGYMPKPPPWAAPLAKQNTVRIGGQTFVGYDDGPGRTQTRTATGYAGGGRVGFADGGGVPYFIGDSIANGLQTAARGEGDTLVGRSPAAVLQAINRATSQQLAGRRIVLSTGLSNNPSDLRSVQAQFAALRAKGVDPSNITVVGLGSRSDIAGVAPSLQNIVNQNGANFTGNFQAGADGVHPANYNQVLRSTIAAPPSVDQSTEVAPAPRVETPSTDEGFVPPRSGAPIQTGGPTPQPRFVVEHGMDGQAYTALNLAPGAGLAPEPTGPGWGPPEGDKWSGGRVGFANGGVTDLGSDDSLDFSQPSPLPAPVPDAPPPMTSADITARGGIGTIGPGSFAPSDQARQLVQMGLEGAGMSRGSAQDISGNFSTEAGALPVSGQLLSGADALYHTGRGEYGQAALSGVGAVPDVGPLAHGVGAMFLGPVARFADREGLGAAKTALQAGEHPYDVWSQHLWEQGPGDSLRTEIADPTETQAWGQHGETKTIGDIYSHPELYKNYPGLEDTPVDFIGGEHLPSGAMGAYDEANDRFLMNADMPPGQRVHTLTHELQHSVQMKEGWPGGADPAAMDVHRPGTPGNFALNFILKQTTAPQRKAMGRDAIVNEAKRFAYETTAGEAQAENPFARLGMNMPERRAAYPATTEQVPRGNQWWMDPATRKLRFGQDVEDPWDSSVSEASRIMSGRASGGPVQLNGELRRRLALITRPRFAEGGAPDDPEGPPPDPNAGGFAALDKMVQANRASTPEPAPAPQPEAQPVYGGAWGQSAEDAYQYGMGKVGAAMDWAGDKLESHLGTAAATLGLPNAAGFARDARAMLEMPGEGLGRERPTMPAKIAENNVGVLRHADEAFPEGRIATAVPSNKALLDSAHASNERTIGHDTMQADPEMYGKTADLIRAEYPDIKIPANATDEEVHNAFIAQTKSNILALHDAVPDDISQGSRQWYDGANTIASDRARRYGKPLENVGGVYAALSPKMDWFKNVSLGDRLMDTMHNQKFTSLTPEMDRWITDRYSAGATPADVNTMTVYNKLRAHAAGGGTLSDLEDPFEQAHWVRAYDEAHNPRGYSIVNPDGSYAGSALTGQGEPGEVGWAGFKAMANAIRSFNAQDMPTISRAMGDRHKVRSFYNNIVAPYSDAGDVTADTHAIAAAHLRPFSLADKAVTDGLGSTGPKSGESGAKGLYGLYAEAYRQAAAERNILPRQMQSITWEALRGLWSPAEKRSGAIKAGVNNTWSAFGRRGRGGLTLPQVQQQLIGKGIRAPSWFTGGPAEELEP